MNPESLFALSEHLERLSKDGDPLEGLDATVNFEHSGRGWSRGSAKATARRVVGLRSTP